MNKKMNSMVKEAKELLSDYLEQNTYDFSIDNFFAFDNFIVFNVTEYCNSNYDLIVAHLFSLIFSLKIITAMIKKWKPDFKVKTTYTCSGKGLS